MILEMKGVNAFYGNSQILFDMNLGVEAGDSVCILGRNGVGKSTTLRSIIGQMSPKNKASLTGSVRFDGKEISRQPSFRICRAGISYVPQGRMIFPSLTAKENLLLAEKKGVDQKNYWTLDRIYELFPRLKERESVKGTLLSGGEQQMLAIARGLIQNPKLLLLDEITEGLAPIVVEELGQIVAKLRTMDVSILLAEQSVAFAMNVSRYCYIIEKGTVVYRGETASIPEQVIETYLGAGARGEQFA